MRSKYRSHTYQAAEHLGLLPLSERERQRVPELRRAIIRELERRGYRISKVNATMAALRAIRVERNNHGT